ncbi:DUF5658 family protein [Metabacillus herbersteinensis]|uniref:DUF5658 family protein n=1 Tax=Metabacillus herbersteinensis TaxID=283816 RepID=A0ABV6G8C0_9BACI
MKYSFLSLALLNIIDLDLTFIGLHFDLIEENNPLMKFLYHQSPSLFLGVKLSFSIFLLLLVMTQRLPSTFLLKSLTLIAISIYLVVLSLHSIWIYSFLFLTGGLFSR